MEINKILLKWYEKNGRDLPWRTTRNPYKIWVSEIILQQTRVIQGRKYYESFLQHYPDVFSLASARVEEVLKIWQGLGYYSRARNMHATAVDIVHNYKGVFPGKYEELLRLKGIGPYTAAAIGSIAFGETVPAVDGNVKRVVSRIFGISHDIKSHKGLEEVEYAAREIMDKDQPGKHNQAIMDFGAIVCRPKNPDCQSCVLKHECYAFQNNMVDRLPVNVQNKQIRGRYFYYFIIRKGDHIYIEQRKEKDIWNLLYQFPLIESDTELTHEEIIRRMENTWFSKTSLPEITKISTPLKHQLSHQLIAAQFIHLRLEEKDSAPDADGLIEIAEDRLDGYAIPRLIEKYLFESDE